MNTDDTSDDPIRLVGLRCKHATRLISQSLERPLRRSEKLALAFHLLVCKWCRRYRKQLRLIEEMIRAFASPGAPGGGGAMMPERARRRIEEALRKASA